VPGFVAQLPRRGWKKSSLLHVAVALPTGFTARSHRISRSRDPSRFLLTVAPGGVVMPEKKTIARARRAMRSGKSPSTQAAEFVREEIEHVRKGKHGARSAKQAIAIGLSKARRAGVKLPTPEKGTASRRTRRQAERDLERGATAAGKAKKVSPARSRGARQALAKEGSRAASHKALSRQTHAAARKRTAADRSAAAKKGARTRAKAAAGRK